MNLLFIPVWLLKSDLLQGTTYQLCYIGKCFLSNARHSTKHVKHLPSWRGWIVNTSQTGGHLERYYLLDDPTDKLLLLQHCARYWTFLPLHHSSGHRYCVQHQNTCLHANNIYCQETHHSQHRTQNTVFVLEICCTVDRDTEDFHISTRLVYFVRCTRLCHVESPKEIDKTTKLEMLLKVCVQMSHGVGSAVLPNNRAHSNSQRFVLILSLGVCSVHLTSIFFTRLSPLQTNA